MNSFSKKWCIAFAFAGTTVAFAQSGGVSDIVANMVQIPGKNYWIGKTEVTQAQWEAVMHQNPSVHKGPEFPAEAISLNNLRLFLRDLNSTPEAKKAGLTFRLPSGEEWEYACRAGGIGDFCRTADGREINEASLGRIAWYAENSDNQTHAVGTKAPNAFGLYDMIGNVAELTSEMSPGLCPSRGGCYRFEANLCKAGHTANLGGTSMLGIRLCATESKAEADAASETRPEERRMAVSTLLENMVPVPGTDIMMGRFEVTQSQWFALMGDNPSAFTGDDRPVDSVSWGDCHKFLEKLNSDPAIIASGIRFRLPTFEEWNYACRAGSLKEYCRREDGVEITEKNLSTVAWFGKFHTVGTSHVGKNRKPNDFGIYDMLGNVGEWTDSLYTDSVFGTGENHVFALGCWIDDAKSCKSGRWGFGGEGHRADFLGFRLCATRPNVGE